MIRKQIDFHSEEINEIRTLYQQAFPKNEQTDFNLAFLMIFIKELFYGIIKKKNLLALPYYVSIIKIVSILYLAVKRRISKSWIW